MGHYDVGMVCANGHVVTDMAGAVPELAKRFCSKCGAETITTCLSCGASIRGYYHVEGVVSIGFTWTPPAHCHNCGKAYPWTEKKASAVEEMIDELEGLNNEDRAKLKKSIPDIAAETPNSGAAVLRFKRAGAKVGQFGGKLLTDVLSKVAAEAVKKSMGL